MKNKTLKADVAPAQAGSISEQPENIASAQAGDIQQCADSASQLARKLSESATAHLAHPWQARIAHTTAASCHESESRTVSTLEEKQRHKKLANEHRNSAQYWANIEGPLQPSKVKPITPATSEQPISLDLQTVIQDQINQGTYKESVFAAAPELLEALRSVVNYNEADPSLYDGDDDGVLGKIMFKARAALAKAEGRE